MKKIKVAILGATGMVGQKFIVLLENHPWFEIAALGASDESAGKLYAEAVRLKWRQSVPIPPRIAKMKVSQCKPPMGCNLAFSGLDSSIAGVVEESFASYGVPVISNTKNYRMEKDIPLLVPCLIISILIIIITVLDLTRLMILIIVF